MTQDSSLRQQRSSLLKGRLVWLVVVCLISLSWVSAQGETRGEVQEGEAAGAKSPDAGKTFEEAFANGYNKGIFEGGSARRNNKPFDLQGNKIYRQAKSGYIEGVHDADIYYTAFRRGFKEGYEEGYRPKSGDDPTPRPRPVEPTVHSDEDVPDGEIELNAGMEMAVKLRDTLSTRRNERGDAFLVEAVNDVHSRGRLVILQGTPMQGSVVWVKRPGRIKGAAELKLRFEEILLGEGRRVPITASLVSVAKEGERIKDGEGTMSGGRGDDAKTVGVTTGVGVLIGILTGGKRGGVIGAGAGAVVGLGGVLVRRGPDLTLESGTILVIRFDRPATLPIPAQAD